MKYLGRLAKYGLVFWVGYILGIEFQEWHEEVFGDLGGDRIG